jgi:DNA repair exonuclease SbcCD nuclease subunit
MNRNGLYLIADVHLGNHHRLQKIGGVFQAGLNARAREIRDVLANACHTVGGGQLVVAGDLFDTADPIPELVSAAMDHLPEGTVLIPGNHDQTSWDAGHNALGPLANGGHYVWERPAALDAGGGLAIVVVPFRNSPTAQYLRDSLDGLDVPAAERTLLVGHFGIEDGKTPAYLHGSRTSVGLAELVKILGEYGIDDCAAGDWHEHKMWQLGGHRVTQIGALAPTGWDNPGLKGYGSLIKWDAEGFHRQEVPGPRFVADIVAESPPGYRYYRRVTVKDVKEARAYKDVEDTEVVFDRKAVAEASKKAAVSVRSTANLSERIQVYCQETLSSSMAPLVQEAVLSCVAEARKSS